MSKIQDILIDIPDNDLPILAEMYKEHVDWAPFACSLIDTGIRWKASEKYRNSIIFTSPNNSWKTDGTIIVLFQFFCNDIFVMTLDKTCKNLYEGLIRTNRLDFNRIFLFVLVHEDFVFTIRRIIEEKNLRVTLEADFVTYATPIDIAKEYCIPCLPDVYLQELNPSHASEIDSVWTYRYPNSEKYISVLIEMNGGLGLFLKSTNELVAWIAVQCLGQLAFLQTKEEHMRKGYGALLVKAISKKVALRGHIPCGTIHHDNTASINLLELLGSKYIGNCTFIKVISNEQNNAPPEGTF